MTAAGDIDRRRRFRVLWLAVGLVVAALLAAVGLRAAGGFGGDGRDRLPDQLATRVVEVLEQPVGAAGTGPGPEPVGQGHPLTDDGPGPLVCTARTFGFDPPDAANVGQVRVVYAHHMCAAVGPGLSWPGAIRAAGPVAVTLADPPTVRRPEQALPGQPAPTHTDRVRALIPTRYHDLALAPPGLADPAVADELRRRFEAAQDRI